MSSHLTVGQRKIAASQRPASAAFWAGFLDGSRATGFPADRPAAARTGRTRPAAVLDLDLALAERLTVVSRGDDTTLHTLFTAAAIALLNAYTGERDLVVGQPPTVPQPLARVLPTRLELLADDTLKTLLGRLRGATLDVLAHQDYPVELAGAEVEVAVALEGLHAAEAVDAVAADVLFHVRRTEAGFAVEVRTEAERFSPQNATRLAAHYARLLTAALAAPDTALAELDLSTGADAAVVAAANDTTAPFPGDVTLPELFARTVEATPDAVAVVSGEDSLTFAELDRATTRLARTLREQGVGREAIVGVLAERSVEMLVAILAVLKAGAAYLPLDVSLPAARMTYMLEDSKAAIVLAQPGRADLVPSSVTVLELSADTSEDAGEPLETGAATDAAYVIYTSGSTGAPKGVVVEHRSVVNRLHWMQRAYAIGAADTILQKTPVSFDVSVWELFWWHIEGARVALLAPGGEREPEAIVAAVEQHRVTTLHFVPTMLGAFLDYVAATGAQGRLSSLRRVFASGEALGVHHVRRFAELLGHAELVNLYGPTEATVDVSHHRTSADDTVVPIGLPIDNIRLHVLDERRRERPVGLPGELYIAGDGLARGYLHRAELTAERFVENPFEGESRAYRTGDLVRRLPDGSLEYLGRNDSQVKLRGYRIEPGEIERRLLDHQGVGDAVVVVRTGTDGHQRLVGYAVAAESAESAEDRPTEQQLRVHLAGTLPEYMVPARVVVLDAFPLSPNGKLDRGALPEPATEAVGHVEPRTDSERALAGLIAEVLGRDRIGVHDSFFALGGTSIHFVTVLAKARGLGLAFTFQQLFANPTVAALAAVLDEGGTREELRHEFAPFELISEEERGRLPEDVEDAYPMSMLSAGTIFQSEMTRGSSQYHDIIGYLINSGFNAEAFTEAVRILVDHNPIFRTSYRLSGFRDYLQLVHKSVDPPPVFIADVRHLDEAAQEVWYEEWEREEKAHAFDWEYPGLIRLHVHVLRDDLYRYSISQHNSALDGWSINLVHTKLFEIYHALCTDGVFTGKPVPNHLRNFIGLEQQSINSREDRQYWLDRLEDRPRTIIPRLRARDEEAAFHVILQDVPLPRGLSDRIVALAGRLGVPVKTVLLAAHMKVHAVVTGERDVMTGYEHSGRPEVADAEKACGLFLNSVPLRVDIADGSWEGLIRQIYDAETSFLPHRRYPMAKMKQDLQTQVPLFETVFNFTHFYSLKKLRELPEFSLLDVRAVAITEFPFRSEFSRHFYTDEVQLSLHYHTDAFDNDHIVRIGGYFIAALDRMTADPSDSHATRPLLGDEELASLAEFGTRPQPAVADGGDLASGASVVVLDPSGLPAAIGAPGDIALLGADGSRSVVGRGRWLPTGVLERAGDGADEPQAPAPAVEAAPEAEGELSSAAMRVAAVWGEVLGIDPTSIKLTDDFFELGGNSLAAMRAVMMLNGLVTIKDVMRNSRLGEQADLAEKLSQDEGSGVLVRLTPADDRPSATLVCFPYGAGHAVHFRPVADAMRRKDSSFAVLGVELPGHDPKSGADELMQVTDIAGLVVEELLRQERGRIVLWGHCVGSALAIEVARLLTARNVGVEHLFIGAKLLYDAAALHESIDYVSSMTYEDIKRWLIVESGFTGFDELGASYADLLVRTFRHDSTSANAYYLNTYGDGGAVAAQPVTVPTTAVYAADDPVTTGFAERYRDWEPFTGVPRVLEMPGGGHYFTRTRPAKVVEIVLDTLAGSAASAEPKGEGR
ncbi:amino acid adenylation domain-containing protein [Streptomyces sp. NPDC002886]|uniref:amino acid adenylation domain-containing protein n=1 Tax=Streptomyces sp. NPDC002886 TaxID=3364667 RepID=UPI003696086E